MALLIARGSLAVSPLHDPRGFAAGRESLAAGLALGGRTRFVAGSTLDPLFLLLFPRPVVGQGIALDDQVSGHRIRSGLAFRGAERPHERDSDDRKELLHDFVFVKL